LKKSFKKRIRLIFAELIFVDFVVAVAVGVVVITHLVFIVYAFQIRLKVKDV